MPLIGAQGPGSQIAFRGNLDEYPDQFQFPSVVEVNPGTSGISTEVVITGINYKALVTLVGSAASVSVTPYQEATDNYGSEGDFLPGNDPNNPIIIRNKDKLKLKIDTLPPTVKEDYGRIYAANIKIGKRPESVWSITTKLVDNDPDPFSFNSQSGLEVSDFVASNNVPITGIDEIVGIDVFMLSQTGEIRINGGSPVRSGKIFNGQGIDIVDTTSGFYTKDVVNTVQVGTFATTFTHSTRDADKTIDPFTLSTVVNSDVSVSQDSTTITISGADPSINNNNPLPISITSGGQYKVTRGGTIVTQFTDVAGTVENGDVITVRQTSSTEFSTEVSTTLTVSNQSSTFRITTRPRPIDTIPDQFAFNNIIDQKRNVVVSSNEVVLAGMTAFGDEGTASISGTNGTNAEFKVIRNDEIVRDYSSSSSQVQLGDKIQLRVTTSPNSLGDVSATFTVAGTNTFTVLSGVNGSTTSTWSVISALRTCSIDIFSLTNQVGDSGGLQPGELAETSFVSTGFDEDCGITATTSNPNSYLKIGNRQGTSLDNVAIGDIIEVYMSTPYFDQTRTTTVTLTSSFGTSRSADWSIGPVSPPLPELDLNAVDRNVAFVFPNGGTAILNYVYNFVTNATVTTNFGVISVPINTLSSGSKSGSATRINLPAGTTNFTMTVSNSTGSTSDNVDVIVGVPPNPTISLCPSDTSTCSNTSNNNKGGSIRLFWKTTNCVRTESPDFSTGGKQNGNILIENLIEDDKVFTITAIGAGNPAPTATATHTANLRPFVDISTDRDSIILGESVTLSWTSEFATEVANSSGFSTRDLSGTLNVTPTTRGNFTFGITVRDTDGVQTSDSTNINVIEDISPFSFRLDPDSFDNLNRGQRVETQPVFTEGDPNSLGGLSPGVSLVATLTGQGNPKFTKNNSTTLNVENGTPTNDLKFFFNASDDFNVEHIVSLAIGDKSDSVSASTDKCIVENSTETLDGMVWNMRRLFHFNSKNTRIFNDLAFLDIKSGGQDLIKRFGEATPAYQEFPCVNNTQTDYTWTAPSGISEVIFQAIGGGGAGSTGKVKYTKTRGKGRQDNVRQTKLIPGSGGGGGGAAQLETTTVASGTEFFITVGAGGNVDSFPTGGKTEINPGKISGTSAIFISVIDEASSFKKQQTVDNAYANFQAEFPGQPFYILQPGRTANQITLPSSWNNDKLSYGPIQVGRQDGRGIDVVTDWFDLLDLKKFGRGTLISLSIDDSGSMKRSSVEDSITLFFEKTAAAEFTIVERSMATSENWIAGHTGKTPIDIPLEPFITAFGGKAGSTRGGQGGIFSGSPSDGLTGGNGGSGVQGSSNKTGHGGGSGIPIGGKCDDGSDCGNTGFGGGSGKGSTISGGECKGDNCMSRTNNGGDANGGGFGAGGGGGQSKKLRNGTVDLGRGGNGGNGHAKILWKFDFPDYTKAQVVDTIRRTHWDDIGRAPTFEELKVYYNLFKDRPDLTGQSLGEFEIYMKGKIADIKNTRSEDNCGNVFPLIDF
tara:strand:+ start:25486 stop:30003 length:4518 start_codon:yes stop_codon:yes gene_type:complete